MNNDLSEKKQLKKILNFIKDEILGKGYPPAVREICDAVGLKSTSTVHGHLERLEKKKVISAETPVSQELLKLLMRRLCHLKKKW